MVPNKQVWTNDCAFYVCTFLKLLLFLFFVYVFVQFWFPTTTTPESTKHDETAVNSSTTEVTSEQQPTTKRTRIPKLQPSTPKPPPKTLLQELLRALYVHHAMCIPSDISNPSKHRIPVAKPTPLNNNAGPRATIVTYVAYVAVALLLTSLVAAFLEVYKAKARPVNPAKAPLTRKCSLADLTVLRHNRKELVRRESILEGCAFKGTRPAPLNRRCSFPATHGEHRYTHASLGGHATFASRAGPGTDSRRTSIDAESIMQGPRHSHVRLVRRC